MPVDWTKYPADWKSSIRPRILRRAAGRCECRGECGLDHEGRCPEIDRTPARWAAAQQALPGLQLARPTVILTIAHMDHDTTHNEDANLRALCQRCHLRYDRTHHAQSRAQNQARRSSEAAPAQMRLPEEGEP